MRTSGLISGVNTKNSKYQPDKDTGNSQQQPQNSIKPVSISDELLTLPPDQYDTSSALENNLYVTELTLIVKDKVRPLLIIMHFMIIMYACTYI